MLLSESRPALQVILDYFQSDDAAGNTITQTSHRDNTLLLRCSTVPHRLLLRSLPLHCTCSRRVSIILNRQCTIRGGQTESRKLELYENSVGWLKAYRSFSRVARCCTAHFSLFVEYNAHPLSLSIPHIYCAIEIKPITLYRWMCLCFYFWGSKAKACTFTHAKHT